MEFDTGKMQLSDTWEVRLDDLMVFAVTQMEKIKPIRYRGDFDKIHSLYMCISEISKSCIQLTITQPHTENGVNVLTD